MRQPHIVMREFALNIHIARSPRYTSSLCICITNGLIRPQLGSRLVTYLHSFRVTNTVLGDTPEPLRPKLENLNIRQTNKPEPLCHKHSVNIEEGSRNKNT